MQSLLCEVAKVGESLASFFSARGESFACTRLLETEGDESKPVGGGWPRYIYIYRERERENENGKKKRRSRESSEYISRLSIGPRDAKTSRGATTFF